MAELKSSIYTTPIHSILLIGCVFTKFYFELFYINFMRIKFKFYFVLKLNIMSHTHMFQQCVQKKTDLILFEVKFSG